MNTISFQDPKAAISECMKYIRNISDDDFIKKPQHKKKREQFIAAQFCAGYRKYTGKKWYLKMKDDDPPDFIMCFQDDDNKYQFQGVEIVSIPERALEQEGYEEQICKMITNSKISKIASNRENQILCISLDFNKKDLNIYEITQKLSDMGPAYREVWALYICADSYDDLSKTVFAMQSIWPIIERVEYSLAEF